MDRKTILKLKKELGARPNGTNERLVIHVAPPIAVPSVPPSPETFSTRKEYREALIFFDKSAEHPVLDSLVKRLNAMGLVTSVSLPSQAVVVEGPTETLIKVLDERDIEDADLDRQIDLIRPDRSKVQ